jgi:uncharacterized protein (TIGR02270 family)
MATFPRTFLIELYREYLEEASFLYEQRLALLDDPEISWKDLGEFEERFEAHIDGLMVGEELAVEVCMERVEKGDFGELHAAVRVFCRRKRKDLVLRVLEGLELEDIDKGNAVADALKDELPGEWQGKFIEMLAERGDDPKLVFVLASVFGHRRVGATAELLNTMPKASVSVLPKVLRALGRLRDRDIRDGLLRYLRHDDVLVRETAALAVLRAGNRDFLDQIRDQARVGGSLVIPLGLAGDRSALEILLGATWIGQAKAEIPVAMGLLGDVAAVQKLLSSLEDPEAVESAALAMQIITGAQLYEEVFVPEEIDEAELSEEEHDKWKAGERPMRPDGRPFGTTVQRLSADPGRWKKWWAENGSRFDSSIRYRNGKPFSPACLLETLESEKSTRFVRQMAYEELVIRYDLDVPFETDMPVLQQTRALVLLSDRTRGGRFGDGAWYFAGRPM